MTNELATLLRNSPSGRVSSHRASRARVFRSDLISLWPSRFPNRWDTPGRRDNTPWFRPRICNILPPGRQVLTSEKWPTFPLYENTSASPGVGLLKIAHTDVRRVIVRSVFLVVSSLCAALASSPSLRVLHSPWVAPQRSQCQSFWRVCPARTLLPSRLLARPPLRLSFLRV